MSLFVLLGAGCKEQPSDDPQEGQSPPEAETGVSAENADEEKSAEMDGESTETKTESMEDAKSASAPASSDTALTDAQEKRIGVRLRRLIRDEGDQSIEAIDKRGAAPIYEVVIVSENADALREAGIPLNSVQGQILTARLTVSQILEAATVESVRTIRAAKKYEMHTAPSGEPPGQQNPE